MIDLFKMHSCAYIQQSTSNMVVLLHDTKFNNSILHTGDPSVGSVEIGENSNFLYGYCFYIALGGEDQDGIWEVPS